MLVGCSSSMTEQQCTDTNWYTRGVTDAWEGKTLNYASDYEGQCAEHDIHPDLKAWRKGYLTALHQQCPESKAMEIAATQQNYTGPCLADADFQKTLQMGAAAASQKIELEHIEKRLQEIQTAKQAAKTSQKQDLEWEEYQLQQELLDIKGTLQIADPEPINKSLFKK